MRTFDTGATRDADANKPDYEGFLSPLVVARFGQYMNKHRVQADGGIRDSDNWQKGIPQEAYIKSAFRHFMDWWTWHRWGYTSTGESVEDALCALLFNVQGYLHEYIQMRGLPVTIPEQRVGASATATGLREHPETTPAPKVDTPAALGIPVFPKTNSIEVPLIPNPCGNPDCRWCNAVRRKP